MNKKYLSFLIIICIFSIVLTGCAQLFQEKLEKPDLDDEGFWRAVNIDKMAQLDAPKHFFAMKGGSSTKVLLSWEKVIGAVAYRIEYAEVSKIDGVFPTNDEDKQWDVLESTVYGTSYNHVFWQTSAPTISDNYDKRFYYRVIAKNERDGIPESEPSNEDYGTLLSPVKDIEADKGEEFNTITVKWKPIENAVAYEIYRSINQDGSSAVKRGEKYSNMTQYTDNVSPSERGVNFYYLIYARNKSGVLSAVSEPALGFARIPGAPGKTTGVKADRAADPKVGITVNWASMSGAEYYKVYRSDSTSSSLRMLSSRVNDTTFKDTSALEPGVYYYYQVTAINLGSDGKERSGAFSETDRSDISHASVGFLLSPPTVIEAESVDAGVYMRWLPAIGADSEYISYTYSIYGDSRKDGNFNDLVVSSVPTTFDADGYIFTTITGSAHKYYKIVTSYNNGKSSDKSIVFAPSPVAVTNVSATKAANPSPWGGGTATGGGIYPVNITWNAAPNAYGYYVYRSTKPASNYRRITENPVYGTSYSDRDETMQPQTYYYYKVLSLNDLNQGKNYSDYDFGYGALTATQFLIQFGKQIKSSQKKMTLMHKGGTAALGSEGASGNYSGSLNYNASLAGLGARITMPYSDYCDSLIKNYYKHIGGDLNDPNNYVEAPVSERRYMIFNGNTNTSANMSSDGSMDGTVNVSGMYRGTVGFGNIQIKGGNAAGGHYPVTVNGFGTENIPYHVIN